MTIRELKLLLDQIDEGYEDEEIQIWNPDTEIISRITFLETNAVYDALNFWLQVKEE